MLSKLIKHSYQNVPYYSEVFKSLKLRPDDIREIEDLKKLPILTKKDIRENFPNRIIGQNIPIKHRIPLGSSGSTGEPLRFYITNLSYSLSIGTSLRGWYWMGYKLGDKYAKISVNSRSGISKKSQDLVNRCLYLHSKSVSEEDIRNILHKLDKFKPEFIRGYPSTLFLISDYIIKNDIKMIKPKAIDITGEICFGYMRQKIEDAFSSKIYDAYSGEGGATMFEAPDHLSYFIAHEQAITEVIDEDGSEVEEGSGEVVSTNL